MQISRANLEFAATLDRWADAPEGWTKLGSGSSRTAFLGPDGLVYKVSGRGDSYQNRAEANAVWTWRKRTDLPEWCIIPRAYYHAETEVTVMEYFEGTQPQCGQYAGCQCGQAVCWKYRRREIAKLGWCDEQRANALLTASGHVVIIDLGCD
jgi:hypothetical protein